MSELEWNVEYTDGRVEPIVLMGHALRFPNGITKVSFRTFSGATYEYSSCLKATNVDFDISKGLEYTIEREDSYRKFNDDGCWDDTNKIKRIYPTLSSVLRKEFHIGS